jgi:hypothetical protein
MFRKADCNKRRQGRYLMPLPTYRWISILLIGGSQWHLFLEIPAVKRVERSLTPAGDPGILQALDFILA